MVQSIDEVKALPDCEKACKTRKQECKKGRVHERTQPLFAFAADDVSKNSFRFFLSEGIFVFAGFVIGLTTRLTGGFFNSCKGILPVTAPPVHLIQMEQERLLSAISEHFADADDHPDEIQAVDHPSEPAFEERCAYSSAQMIRLTPAEQILL